MSRWLGLDSREVVQKSNLLSATRSGVQQHLCGRRGAPARPKWWSVWFWDNWYEQFIVEHVHLYLHLYLVDVTWILHRVWSATWNHQRFYCLELCQKITSVISGTVSGGDWKRFTFFYGPTNLETCLPGLFHFQPGDLLAKCKCTNVHPTDLETCLPGEILHWCLTLKKCSSLKIPTCNLCTLACSPSI